MERFGIGIRFAAEHPTASASGAAVSIVSLSIVAARAPSAWSAKSKSADSRLALRGHDLFDAIGDDLPFVIVGDLQAFLVTLHHPLAHLLRIKVPAVLGRHLAGAEG